MSGLWRIISRSLAVPLGADSTSCSEWGIKIHSITNPQTVSIVSMFLLCEPLGQLILKQDYHAHFTYFEQHITKGITYMLVMF
jgi:hypothetical protein